MTIDQKLKEIILKIATQDTDINNINEETILTDDIGYDSIEIIELIVELESEFNIEIDDDDLEIENLIIYKKLYKMVKKKTKSR